MSIIGSNILAGASGQGVGGYTIETSLRFRSSASAYLNWTPASAGSGTTVTFSAWVKRGYITSTGSFQQVFGSHTGTNAFDMFGFDAFDRLVFRIRNSSAVDLVRMESASVYRDPSAWYHIVGVYDSTNATSTERVRLYVNGERITAFDTATYPSSGQGFTGNFLTNMQIGRGNTNSSNMYYFDGYLTEVNFIDGQALDASSFGEYNADTGVWQPVAYAGTYGTNGFYLPFSDATTTTTLGADSSGNGNDWTTHNISLTTGATYDSMTDTPTSYADGGNYCVLNPLNTTNGAVAQGNLYWSSSGASGFLCTGTIAFDIADTVNKYYFEIQLAGGDGAIGIAPTTLRGSDTGRAGSYSYYTTGSKYSGVTASAYGAAFAAPNIIGVAVGAGKITFYKNGVSQGDAFTGLTGLFVPMLVEVSGTFNANFGQRPFAYTPPTGFLPLHTGNLPDSSIVDGSKYFDVTTYTGNGSTQSITGLEFQPDLTWIKARSSAYSHRVFDSVRGATLGLNTNGTNAEFTESGVTSFDADGFTLGSATNENGSGTTFVGWNWKANGTGVSNTDGSITSTVSANPTAGFSIVTYTGNGSTSPYPTVGHGLGVAPQLIFTKARSTTSNWVAYTTVIDGSLDFLYLNTTAAKANSGLPTLPTSSVFQVGGPDNNSSGQTHVAYCFSEVEGYSKFGSYTGNGSADGPFIFTNFRPAFVMVKRVNATNNWIMWDNNRSQSNVVDDWLYASLSDAEASANGADFLSNGFKLRNSANAINGAEPYIFMAFAESPFKSSLAR